MTCEPVTLAGINSACDVSLGGVKKVWMAEHSTVLVSASTAQSGESAGMITAITPTTASSWTSFEFRKNSAQMTSTYNTDDANLGESVQTDLELTFTKMEAAKRAAVNALCKSEVAVVVLDANGKYWFLGKDLPVYVSASTGVTGQNRTDANNYTVTLTDVAAGYPYEIQKEVADAIFNVEE